MRHILLAAMVAIAFGLSAAPVQAEDVASASVEGECNYGEQGASDSAGVTVSDDPGASEDLPEQSNVEEGVSACQSAAENGDTPDGGSHVGASASAGGEDVSVSSSAVTGPLTGALP